MNRELAYLCAALAGLKRFPGKTSSFPFNFPSNSNTQPNNTGPSGAIWMGLGVAVETHFLRR
jgi:hypothetical protein